LPKPFDPAFHASFEKWLTYAANDAKNELVRKQSQRPDRKIKIGALDADPLVEDDEEFEDEIPCDDPEAVARGLENLRREFPEEHWLVQRKLLGMSPAAIIEQIEKATGDVLKIDAYYQRVSRAVKKLKQAMGRFD
jgi:DNA-directed RNA polymerase specialized sigma24 family protein